MKIRVLEGIATLKPAGAEHIVLSLSSGLDRSRFETAVVSLYDPFAGGLEPSFEEQRIPVLHLGKRRGPSLQMYERLRRIVNDFRPHVIHSHGYVMRYMLHLDAPVRVHTVHNMASSEVGPFGRMVHRYSFSRGVAAVAVGAV